MSCPPFRRKGGGVHCGSLCGAPFFGNLSTFSGLRINLSDQSTLISTGQDWSVMCQSWWSTVTIGIILLMLMYADGTVKFSGAKRKCLEWSNGETLSQSELKVSVCIREDTASWRTNECALLLCQNRGTNQIWTVTVTVTTRLSNTLTQLSLYPRVVGTLSFKSTQVTNK